MSTLQRAVPAGNVTVPWLIVTIPSSTGQSAPRCLWFIILTPNLLQGVMLLCVERAGAAGGWGGKAGGGACPVTQLDLGVHICPGLPIPEEPLETQPWTTFMLDKLLDFSPR